MRRRDDGRTVLDGLRQSGCLKARFPRSAGDGAEIVTLNLSGGIAAGDALAAAITVGAGSRGAVAGQAAERFYRALPGSLPARVRTALSVADGGILAWLPQESILFEGASLDRVLDIDLAETARFVGVESLVFGRAAMGERVTQVFLRDVIRIRREGRLVLHDAVRLAGDADRALSRSAVGGGSRAFATVVCADPAHGAGLLDEVRQVLDELPVEAGVSAWDGLIVVRIAAATASALRAAVVPVLSTLRGGAPLPRVWLC